MEQIWAAVNSSQVPNASTNSNNIIVTDENQITQQHRRALIKALDLIRKMAPILVNKFRPFLTLPSQETTANIPIDDHPASGSSSTAVPDDDDGRIYIKGDDDEVIIKCVICLYEIVKGEKYRVLEECKHGFHVDCIDGWLHHNPTCPICRRPVPYAATVKQQIAGDNQALPNDTTVLSSFVALVDHLWRWFLNPLGFDDDDSGCDHMLRDDPNYVI
ncbi:OLC1v1015258C1 [Oldenlandia corymbosa var. corymbosa]|uniref:OLC1v1015258C1 n=1 Tax=Oldenlandia corymbosa var. corymbosa TaxID=529605 RepID=A0AAV1E586_OLDCO|nr:OLC1v1015258C1 [Oldenlandia corymbosa var. corymbosa]